jgi:glycosyltransferase involved in cell wall biosynthesis
VSLTSSETVVHIGPSRISLPALRGGAIERRMIELASAQGRSLGAGVFVYSVGARMAWEHHRGITIRYVRALGTGVLRRLVFGWRAAADIAALGPRVVHVHNIPEIVWFLRRRGVRCPIVLSRDCHLEPFNEWRGLRGPARFSMAQCMNCAEVVAVVSDYCKQVHERYWSLPQARLTVLHNGVDLAHFKPDPRAGREWRTRLGLGDKRVILYVGRVCRQKGTDVLLEAYRQLRSAREAPALVVVGPPDAFGETGSNRLIDATREAGGTYLPPVLDAGLPGVYSLCDVFVMPTRELEMFGMAAVEAQACGKPVVASDHGGLRETVPPEVGFRFRNGSASDLADKLGRLLMDPGLRARFAEAARTNATKYAWDKIAQRSLDLYARLQRQTERVPVVTSTSGFSL